MVRRAKAVVVSAAVAEVRSVASTSRAAVRVMRANSSIRAPRARPFRAASSATSASICIPCASTIKPAIGSIVTLCTRRVRAHPVPEYRHHR
uniref:Putative secreted protein n=1 Tax=Anopheles triannulatus TaxID=58253 RepID=A0A2M4B7B9_9DIPT